MTDNQKQSGPGPDVFTQEELTAIAARPTRYAYSTTGAEPGDFTHFQCPLTQREYDRLLATARAGLEDAALLNELADLADALRHPVALAYDGATTRAAILAKVLDWSDKRHMRSGREDRA